MTLFRLKCDSFVKKLFNLTVLILIDNYQAASINDGHYFNALQPQELSPHNIPVKANYSCVKANIHAACRALLFFRIIEKL